MPEVLWNYRLYLAPFGPSVAAFVLTYLNGEKEGVLKLLKKGIDYRFPKVWYLPIFLLMPFITGVSLLLLMWSGENPSELSVLSKP
ncbi:hypothetical protein [Thermococcus sp. 2319x1]|uniref:hypothetical protein n=1 Tax=Thermococcus sp. 2319x1 TaxID=1674923 RepID=UPI00073D5AFF|nr:hypothetical protein [Thermococcus sp. 2319x1]